MVKKLVKHGNSYALVIDKPIMELLNITPDSELEVTTKDGEGLFVRPTVALHRVRVKEATRRLVDEHAETLRKLAQ